jgi:hypothetical protein
MRKHIVFCSAVLLLGADKPLPTVAEIAKSLPPYFTLLADYGVRPEWDETSENVYFLDKLVGNVQKINIKTRQVTPVTAHLEHKGVQRVATLSNGDLLLGLSIVATGNITVDKEKLAMYVLKKKENGRLYPLGELFTEGMAVSKRGLKIAWTTPGQREIRAGEIVYKNGTPTLAGAKTIVSYKDQSPYVRLETQDLRPPDDEELIYTHYWGDARDSYHHAEVYGYNLRTGKTTNYTKSPDSYDEAEGIFPDGRYTMIESDRHHGAELRHKYKVDIYRLKLDGSGEAEQLLDLSARHPQALRSDNPVVDRTGRFVAFQFGFSSRGDGAHGRGILMMDLQAYERAKKSR